MQPDGGEALSEPVHFMQVMLSGIGPMGVEMGGEAAVAASGER